MGGVEEELPTGEKTTSSLVVEDGAKDDKVGQGGPGEGGEEEADGGVVEGRCL